jgi:ferredoxin
MVQINVQGYGTFMIDKGKKLVNALEDHGVDLLHRCGGKAKCATCRVEVLSGDLGPIGEKEATILKAKGLPSNMRLSCQICVTENASIKPALTVSSEGLDAGPRPDEEC